MSQPRFAFIRMVSTIMITVQGEKEDKKFPKLKRKTQKTESLKNRFRFKKTNIKN